MMSKLKCKIKYSFYLLISLFLQFILSILLTFSVSMFLSKLNLISENQALIWALILALVISIVLKIYDSFSTRRVSKSAFEMWIHNNKASLMLFYLFLCITFSSIRTELSWDYEKAKNILTLEWTILGLSIAMFLVWSAIIPKYFSDKKISDSNIYSTIQKAKIIERKYSFYEDINGTFGSITLLTINMVVLLLTTSNILIQNDDITLLSQNLVIISFYLCTNAFSDIFLGILIPLKQTKKELLDGANVCKKDLAFVENVNQQLENTAILFREIDSMDGMSEAEKEKIKREACRKFLLSDILPKETLEVSSSKQNSN